MKYLNYITKLYHNIKRKDIINIYNSRDKNYDEKWLEAFIER